MRSPLLAVLLLAAPLVAADPPKGGGTVQMLIARIDGDKLVTSATTQIPRAVAVSDPAGPKSITVTETVTTSTARELKYLKATGTDDKEVPAAEFKAQLKDGGLVVFLTAPLDPSWKAKFKKGTLFVEYAAPKEEKKDEEKKGDEPKKSDPKKDEKRDT
jgi:hypothetical protein